ncbi:MAG: winged helix-turn-helix domain-containing tetratricopeptide repeat protein [Vicinamibacterales bacterium]
MSSGSGPAMAYRFGVFEVECASASLRREGTLVRLRGKPFDILLFLLERPGELVTRDALRHELWGTDTFVDFDHGLNAAMNRLRDALGDRAENPRFIQTVPRKGYRFIAPVQRITRVESAPLDGGAAGAPGADTRIAGPAAAPALAAIPPAPPAGRRRWAIAAAASLLVAAAAVGVMTTAERPARARPMLAVLPFQNLSGTPDQDYFSDGFTDELIAQMGALNPEALGVISRSTVSRYREGRPSAQEIGRALDVEYILEGAIRRSGNRVRITAQLIDVHSQSQLWSEVYEHDVPDVLLTQRDVAMRVADALTMKVLRVATVGRMASPEAYDDLLRGKAQRLIATEASLARAREYFEHALSLDPGYAQAHAGLADVYHVLGGPGWELARPRDVLPQALASAERAIALDPRLPDGYAVRGMVRLWLGGDVAGAEEDLRHAIALNASYALAHQYLSTVLVVSGRPDEAVTSARRAMALDPLSPSSGTTLGYRLYYAGRDADAVREFDRALEGTPDYVSAWIGKAQALRALGRRTDSRAALERAVTRAGGRSYVRAALAYAMAMDGDREGARAILRDLETLSASHYVSPYDFALVSAGLGDAEGVRRQLARLLEDGSGWAVFVPIERELAPYARTFETLRAAAVPAAPRPTGR